MLAAAEAVAERGVGAPTALIAKLAGVAEGTLFRYFPTKEALLNEMYLYICELGWASAHEPYDLSRPLLERAWYLWNTHVDWCLANPVWDKALSQLAVTEILTQETRDAEAALFPDVGLMETVSAGEVLAGHPSLYGDALFLAVANATIDFARREPERVDAYKASGFAAFRRMFLD